MSTTTKSRVTTRTGELCPVSGVWQPGNYPTTAPIAIGNKMPPYAGQAVIWSLLYKA